MGSESLIVVFRLVVLSPLLWQSRDPCLCYRWSSWIKPLPMMESSSPTSDRSTRDPAL